MEDCKTPNVVMGIFIHCNNFFCKNARLNIKGDIMVNFGSKVTKAQPPS